MTGRASATSGAALRLALPVAVFALIVVAGLLQVKWLPYYHRAFTAAASHSIGGSILMGDAARPPVPSLEAALSYALAYGKAIWKAMVLGLLVGSAVQALLPADWIARLLGRTGFGSILAGGVLALPGMMCTCCAAPVVAGLRRQRASAGAAMAFWLGNTLLNPAALMFIGFVLGWRWTALRLGFGLVMVFGLGWLADRMMAGGPRGGDRPLNVLPEPEAEPPSFRRWLRVLAGMALRILPEYVVLVMLLGAARAWLFPAVGPQIGDQFAWILAFAAAGTLFVIPTAGEAPIIQAMLALGVGAGPAAALLMTLPPVSLPSMVMLGRSFPRRILAATAVGVALFGVGAGLLASGLGFGG